MLIDYLLIGWPEHETVRHYAHLSQRYFRFRSDYIDIARSGSHVDAVAVVVTVIIVPSKFEMAYESPERMWNLRQVVIQS